MFFSLTACKVQAPFMTSPICEVYSVTNQTVVVGCPVVNRKPGDVAINIFYYEHGHGFKKGDVFSVGN